MKLLKWTAFTLILLVALIYSIGLIIDPQHSVSIRAKFKQPRTNLWHVVADFTDAPNWNPHLTSVERIVRPDGKEVWREDYEGRIFYFETVEFKPEEQVTRRILNDDLPYGGTWTFRIYEDTEGQGYHWVEITEDGEIHNPFARVMAKFFIGYASTIGAYLQAYGKKFDEKIYIELVEPRAS